MGSRKARANLVANEKERHRVASLLARTKDMARKAASQKVAWAKLVVKENRE